MREQGAFFAGRWLLCLLLLGLTSTAFAAPASPDADPPSSAAPPGDAALRRLLRKVTKLKEPPESDDARLFERVDLEDPYQVLMRAARESPEPAHAIAKLRERYALNEAAARSLLIGQLASRPPDRASYDVTPEETRLALDSYRQAARQAPGSLVVLAAMLSLPRSYTLPAPEREAPVLEALDASPSPVDLALQLSRGGMRLFGWEVSLAAYAVSRQPDVLPRALEILGLRNGSREATLFYFATYQSLRSQPQATVPPALAERLLRNLLKREMPSLAVELLRQLPASQRDELLAGRSVVQDIEYSYGSSGAVEKVVPPEDIRLDVSAALLLAGDRQAAKAWFESARNAPVPEDGDDSREAQAAGMQRDILAFALESKPGQDPFELLVLSSRWSLQQYPWYLLLAQQLQSQYPEETRSTLSFAVKYEREEKRAERIPLRERLTFLDGASAAFEAADKARLAQLESALAAVPKQAGDDKPAAPPDPVASRIRELLAAPSASPFTEHPLSEASKSKSPERWSPVKGELKPPAGFYPIRAERSGKRVLLLALSQRLDPAGEVSGGGYWLLESRDGGGTWDSLLYTGLRQYRPYELAKQSSLPMLDGDTLRLQASVRELEEKSITFPPIRLSTKREKKNLFLRASLSELQKDSDADGLPDLVEERLLTDPKAADTDADGLPDGEDPLPQVPSVRGGPESPEASLLAAFIATRRGGEEALKGLEVGLPDEGTPRDDLRLPKGPTPESRYDVTFLEMDRGALRGVRLPSRTVVLTTGELSLAQERFGRFYPMSIDIRFNAKGDQALIDWNEHWRGGSYRARLTDGKWVLESFGGWIT